RPAASPRPAAPRPQTQASAQHSARWGLPQMSHSASRAILGTMADGSPLCRRALALPASLDRTPRAFAWLVLPLALLLFAQWPLRDLVGLWSPQANDIAQWVFAIYIALALREATRKRAHMAAGLFVSRYPPHWQHRIARFGEAVAVLPWAVFVLVSG